jgi:hypothetical protein
MRLSQGLKKLEETNV